MMSKYLITEFKNTMHKIVEMLKKIRYGLLNNTRLIIFVDFENCKQIA